MKLSGKKHLNSNLYDKIVIKELENDIKISVSPDKRFKNAELIKTSGSNISDAISKLDEKEKLIEIIKYFLRNNMICQISENDNKIVITSTSNRKLILNLSSKYLDILNYIIEKYNSDRIQFIEECDVNKIYIRTAYFDGSPIKYVTKTTSYGIFYEEMIDDEEEVLVLTLMQKNKKLASFDEEFIDEFIKKYIEESEEIKTHIDYRDNNYSWTSISDLKTIVAPFDIIRKYNINLLNHNYKVKKEKAKQLCLELEKENE